MKKLQIALAAAALLTLSGAAYAAVGGHVGVIVDVNHGSAEIVDQSVADAIGAHPIVPSDSTQDVTADHVRNEIAPHFDGTEELHFLALPPLAGGVHGHNVVKVDHEHFSNFSAENIRLFLRHHDYDGGNNAVEIPYAYEPSKSSGAEDIPDETYAFLDEKGENPSPIATASSNHLVVHLRDNADYDHDRTIGVVEVHPQFAAVKKSSGISDGGGSDSGGSGGGGGCDTGAASFVLLFLSGVGAVKAFRKS